MTGKPVLSESGNFASNSARILKTADRKLTGVADTANQHPEITLEASGDTDHIGSLEENPKLSELRAAFVKMWLVDHGVADDRISTAGYAYQKPIAGNKAAAGRTANRRVEIRYVIQEEERIGVTESFISQIRRVGPFNSFNSFAAMN